VYADVQSALARRPTRVTGVWLIVSTVFGALPASVDFRHISIDDARGVRYAIFPA